MSIVSFALVSLSFAEPSADMQECGYMSVSVTSPAPLATGVPIDVVPAALLTGQSCGSQSWLVTLVDASTGDEVAAITHVEDDGALIEIDLGADLAPDTTYPVRFEPLDGLGEHVEIGFTTGSGTTVGLDGAPTVESAAAAWSREGVLTVQAEIGVAASVDGPSIVAFALEGGDDLAYTSATGPTFARLSGFTFASEAPAEVCVVARQRDLAGRWAESDADCVVPEVVASDTDGGGCFAPSGGRTTPALAGLLFLAGLARRPRR